MIFIRRLKSFTRPPHLGAPTTLGAALLLLLPQLACEPKAEPTAAPGPSAWLTPPDASGLPPLPDEPPEPEPTTAPAAAPDDIQVGPVRKVRPSDLPPLLPAPTARDQDSKASNPEAIFSSYGFPSQPGLTPLCAGRVYEGGGHLTWDAFTTSDSAEPLIKRFTERLSERGFHAETGGGSWRLPADSKSPDRVLSVLPLSAPGPHKTCDAKPPDGAVTVIIVSSRH